MAEGPAPDPAQRHDRLGARGGAEFSPARRHVAEDLHQDLPATLIKKGKKVCSSPIGVGQNQWPTPKGQFYIRAKLTGYKNPVYGPLAFVTSATSPTLTDWPGGGIVGIHGTNQPGLIPGKISHGCVRVANANILKLDKLMKVGTPLTVT